MLIKIYNKITNLINDKTSRIFRVSKRELVLLKHRVFLKLKNRKLKQNSNMRLGVAYNLFDGEELLEYSIKSIRKNVDFICVVWQKISNHGEKCNLGVEELLNSLMSKGLVDEIYLYEPYIKITNENNASINETNKRNIGLELCKKNNCDYFMTIDTDEFYTDEQFRFMKNEMLSGNYGTGYCQHRQYYYDSIYQLEKPEREYISTIEKIIPSTKYVYNIPCILTIDPTRKTNNVLENKLSYRVFNRKECEMHHLSFVRKDIKKKLMNSSAKRFFSEESIDKINSYYKNWKYPKPCMWAGEKLLKIIKVPRQFEIYKID